MYNFIKTEFLKLNKMISYKILLVGQFLLAVAFLSIMVISQNYSSESGQTSTLILNGYSIFEESLSQVQSNSVFISIFAALFICTEFSNRTVDLAIAAGKNRTGLFIGKMIAFFAGCVGLISVLPLVMTIFMTIKEGFGVEVTPKVLLSMVTTYLLYLVVSLAVASIIGMICYLVKNIGGSMVISIIVTMVSAVLVQFALLPGLEESGIIKISRLTPFYTSNILKFDMAGSDQLTGLGVSIVYLGLMLLLAGFAFNKSELK